MTNQDDPKEPMHQQIIAASSDKIKAIFDDDDVVRLEYPADEFPLPHTQIIIIFSEESGKEPQYIELQDWLDLVEDYKESQQEKMSEQNLPQSLEHGDEFVCVVSFRVNGDDDNVGRAVVEPADRENCVNTILEKYPYEQLDFSIEFMCKKCFKEMLNEQEEEAEINYYGSRMIH